eukprot:635723-Amphidinium_carterae.2
MQSQCTSQSWERSSAIIEMNHFWHCICSVGAMWTAADYCTSELHIARRAMQHSDFHGPCLVNITLGFLRTMSAAPGSLLDITPTTTRVLHSILATVVNQ